MKTAHYQIQENPLGTINATCAVDLTADGETVGLEFPTLSKADDNIGPMVYACIDSSQLVVRLTGPNDIEWAFAWDEKERKWFQRETPNAERLRSPASGDKQDALVDHSEDA